MRYDGPARFPQIPIAGDPRTKLNKDDRLGHSGGLATSASNVSTAWKLRVNDREQANLPVLPKNVPLVLEVDTAIDLDELRKLFGFELVSEQENGFVIVASDDIDLNAFSNSTVSSAYLLVLQWWRQVMRAIAVVACRFDSLQPAGRAALCVRGTVVPEKLLQQARDQVAQSRNRQCRRVHFFPAAWPR